MPANLFRFATRTAPILVLILSACAAVGNRDSARSRQHAERVTIVRDDWGIAHVRGQSDADAVFGMVYAQAEDDFNRVETNYINAMGRLAEAEGEIAIWRDLRMKLFIQPDDLKARYATSPDWLKQLMVAWADGLNYYLETHPEVRPRVITRFEPWMALSFSEGSIGGDIERVSLAELEAFYSGRTKAPPLEAARDKEPTGSNGIAISPANTAGGNALLLINPHTSFFFRAEQQVTSDEGLDVYGAATWGQFFIYQGFNQSAGWMHTSSGVDAVDEYLETVTERDGRLSYRHGDQDRPVITTTIDVPFRGADGAMASRRFEVHRTHHGPIVREQDDRWVSISLMHKPVEALSQSFLRTKARDFPAYMEVMAYQANSSNNTVFADAKGNIAYLHPQFIPRRDDRFDFTKPVDGSDPAADWSGLHALAEVPHVLNPPAGWIQNTNNWPWSAAGAASPEAADFPRYMDMWGENPRGLHAMQLLEAGKAFTLETLRSAAYDSYQPAFATLIPGLLRAWDAAEASDPLKRQLEAPIATLRGWDYRWSISSVANSLAVFWGEAMWQTTGAAAWDEGLPLYERIERAAASQKLEALQSAVARLERDFGSWRTPWGEINRSQRLTADIAHPFSDAAASLPVGFSSARWGSLAAFGAAPQGDSKRMYGTSGNSFVAVVEFGERVRARAVTAGGVSGDPRSPHFNDQAERYAAGDLREVYFYPEDLARHTKRMYRPGER